MSPDARCRRQPAATLFRLCAALLLAGVLFVLLPGRAQAATVKFSAKLSRKNYLLGETGQIKFKNTTRITYKFKSSDKSVFKVNKKGVVTSVGEGSAILTIKGTWRKNDLKQTWKREVPINVYSCRLSRTSMDIIQSKTKTLKIKGQTLSRKIKWYSETPAICKVKDGKVTAMRAGTGFVCAKVGSQLVYRCQVNVTATFLQSMIARLLVNTLRIYGSVNLANEIFKEIPMGDKITYVVSNPALGYMNGNIYNATGYGTNVITAYCGPYVKRFTFSQLSWSAHRGNSDLYPENTIDAFTAAALYGAAFIETDVRVTKDGALVLMHDSALANMTNAAADATVGTMTLAQIRSLTINNGNGLSSLKNKQVPTLDEFIRICSQYGVVAMLDLKSLGKTAQKEAAVKEIMQTLAKYNMTNRAIIISANTDRLKIFRQYAGSAVPIAVSTTERYAELAAASLSNIYARHSQTPFGYMSSTSYSPLVGKKGADLTAYHNRVS